MNSFSKTNSNSNVSNLKKSAKFGHWSMKEDIVITGISGKYPESNSIEEFAINLYNHKDMVTDDDRRWPKEFFGAPIGIGKLVELEKFDSRFFNVSEKEANSMDSQIRILLEIVYEAIWDSGIDPNQLSGSRTGVFIGNCFNEYLNAYSSVGEMPEYIQYIAQMVSHKFNLIGPSIAVDTACASSFNALHEAMLSLRNGRCDSAIVAGINLGLSPMTQLQFYKLNMLSPDGKCKCLDASANGYAKGEACVAILLQKKSSAKRIYATILHTKTNNDGYEEMGITFPSWKTQRDIMKATYAEAGIDPHDVHYIEAHCTGTQAGDPEEMRAISESMCSGNREHPLLVGAHKSNIGHTEASSGLCGVSKVIISLENEIIPANIHFTKANPKIDGIISGILKPINENTPFFGDLAALNNFGFGGSNVHVIVRSPKIRPSDDNNKIVDKIPRLVQMCGRDEIGVNFFFESLLKTPTKITRDLLALINDISKTSVSQINNGISGMSFRGFALIESSDQNIKDIKNFNVKEVKEKNREVWFVMSGMGTQYSAMAKDLVRIDIFEKSIKSLCEIMKRFSIDLWDLLMNDKQNINDSVMKSFLTIAAIQIALIDLLEELDIKPNGIIGHSIGELTCAYADKCLTAEETILMAYWRAKYVEENRKTRGSMAAIGLGAIEAKAICPANVYIACDNSDDSVTVAGDTKAVEEFVKSLKSRDIFAAKVESSGIGFHTPLMYSIENQLNNKLKQIMKTQRQTTKWLSTTSKYSDIKSNTISAQYFVDNLLFRVTFNEALKQIPKNAIVVEVSPHCLLQSIIKRSLGPNISYVSLMRRDDNNLNLFLSSVGTIYTLGLNPSIEKCYPRVEYPVSNGTRILSPLVKWDHSKDYVVTKYPDFFNVMERSILGFSVNLMDKEDAYLSGHKIDGKCLFPATGYLMFVWKQLADYHNLTPNELAVEYKDVNLHRATMIHKKGQILFQSSFDIKTGEFQINEGGSVVVTGTIVPLKDQQNLKYQDILRDNPYDQKSDSDVIVLKTKDIYKELRLRGYDYGPSFQCIQEGYNQNSRVKTKIQWRDNWVTFADCMIQMAVIGMNSKGLFIPVRIDSMRIDPKVLMAEVERLGDNPCFEAVFDYNCSIGVTKGLEYRGAKANLVQRNLNTQKPFIGYYGFVPYINHGFIYNNQNDLLEYRRVCDRLAFHISENFEISGDRLIRNIRAIDDSLLRNSINSVASIDCQQKSQSLYQLLREICETSEQSSVDLLAIDSKRIASLDTDMITDAFNYQPFIESLLVTAYENKLSSEIKVIEINSSSSLMKSEIYSTFDFYEYDCRLNYSLIHSAPEELPSELVTDLDVKQWRPNQTSLPTDSSDIELIVYKDFSVCLQPKDTEKVDLKQMFTQFYDKLKPNGFVFVVCREKITFAEEMVAKILGLKQMTVNSEEVISAAEKAKFTFIGNYSDIFSTNALLFRKITIDIQIKRQTFIQLTHNFDDWIEKLQKQLREISSKPEGDNIWLVSNTDPTNGIIGLFNCLRKESNGNRLRIILNMNSKPNDQLLDINSEELIEIIKKDLKINVFRDNDLGFYQMISMKLTADPILTEHCFLNNSTKGDLTSLKWFECQHKYWPIGRKDNQMLCHIYYSALNFRDIMLATGRLPADALPGDIALQDCILGLEFSGRDENGNRVMGMIPSKALATSCIVDDPDFLWPIPDNWTMEEASTVPCVYATAYYSLIIRGDLKKGEKVLIHSGSGGVGQAAINICLDMNCQLFITVGSNEKRDFLKKLFPKLSDRNFSSSRDLSFKTHVLQQTNGVGVDLVLNSLSEDKLKASLECLADNGRFLEIGKFDMSVNTRLNISEFMRNKTFHGILLDSLFNLEPNTSNMCINDRKMIWQLIKEGIAKGVVKPLNRTVFTIEKCEEAFRFMASGKHMGKVVIKIRTEETDNQSDLTPVKVLAIPRTVFYTDKVYIITGGLGGMGLELIQWMIERGAQKFLVTSRTGPKDSYQFKKLRYFGDSGALVHITNDDLSTIAGAENLIRRAQRMARVGGIFHLQMVLSDGLFENQTADSFRKVCAAKSTALENLDSICRRLCPDIDHFVAYSSGVSSRGNPGQSNYGYSNSVIDRVCDLRRADGLPSLALHWGVIGDVGYVADNISSTEDVEVVGTIPQRMPSCLLSLDRILQSEHSICTSFVRCETKLETKGGKQDLMKRVAHILGLDDYSKLDPNTKLVKLGMDSLMAVEIKQTIERDFDVVLSTQEIRDLTLSMVHNINSGNKTVSEVQDSNDSDSKQLTEEMFRIPNEEWVHLNGITDGRLVFFIPPHNGSFDKFLKISENLQRPVYGINWTEDCLKKNSIKELAKYNLDVIQNNFPNIDMDFDLIGYSIGGVIAYEMSLQLQTIWKKSPKLVLLDSSPIQFKSDELKILNSDNIRGSDEEIIEINVLVAFLIDKINVDYESLEQLLKDVPKDQRLAKTADILIEKSGLKCDRKWIEFAIDSHIKKVFVLRNYSATDLMAKKFDGNITLFRVNDHFISGTDNKDLDYGLSQIITGKVDVTVFDGQHENFLDINSDEIIDKINSNLN